MVEKRYTEKKHNETEFKMKDRDEWQKLLDKAKKTGKPVGVPKHLIDGNS